MQSLAVCKFSVCCTAKWDGFLPWRKLTFATEQECTDLTSSQGASPLQPQWHTLLKLLCCHTQHHQNTGWVWMRCETLGTGVPTRLTCSISSACRQRQVWVYIYLTTKPRAGTCPSSRMGVGRHCLDALGIPHCLWSRSLWITEQEPMLPLTLPLLCIFHCFLISSTAMVFVSRGHFLHSA